ncbi:MAG: hypothetical protein K2I26_00420 [Paramuribaculum sp.]|nr:hypothetical protein [Paramuribaculum sp.]
MKSINKFIFGSAIFASLGVFPACSDEDNTLAGSDDIYIELANSDVELAYGDTLELTARVSNVSGSTIETPITWSVDDESVAKIVDIVRYERVSSKSRAEGEDAGEGDSSETPETPENPENPGDNDTPQQPDVQYREVITKGITSVDGAQGKSTIVRATLENGRFAVAPVSVVSRTLRNSLTVAMSYKRSYQRQPNDTVWFNLSSVGLVDECTFDYEITLTDCYPGVNSLGELKEASDADKVFTFPNEEKQKNIFIDRKYSRIGVVYTAPRVCGKATCAFTMTNNEGESVSATAPILVYPKVSPGFEYLGVRPLAQEPNPNNIKHTLIAVDMDINSTYEQGVCLGVEGGWDQDIFNAYAAEVNGLFYWDVNGSSVIVDEIFTDFNYESGYVSYIKVRSGIQEGLTVLTFYMPDTTLVCNLSVVNYDLRFPVDRIVTLVNEEEVDEVTFTFGQPATMQIGVAPEASFSYHVPEVVSLDPSIITVNERGEKDGLDRSFTLHKPGTTYLDIKSLDKTKRVKVTVNDAVSRVALTPSAPQDLLIGETCSLQAAVYMAATPTVPVATLPAQLEWHVSQPGIIELEQTGAQGLGANIKAIAAGTVEVYATCDGRQSAPVTITVSEISDVVYEGGIEAYINVGENDNLIGLLVGDVYTEFPATYNADALDFTCTASGVTSSFSYNGTDYDNCSFNVVITKGSDADHFVINGTFTMPNGMKVIIKNVVAEIG